MLTKKQDSLATCGEKCVPVSDEPYKQIIKTLTNSCCSLLSESGLLYGHGSRLSGMTLSLLALNQGHVLLTFEMLGLVQC